MGDLIYDQNLIEKVLRDTGISVFIWEIAGGRVLHASERMSLYFPQITDNAVIPELHEVLSDGDDTYPLHALEEAGVSRPMMWRHYYEQTRMCLELTGRREVVSGRNCLIIYILDRTADYVRTRKLEEHFSSQFLMLSDVAPNALGAYRLNLTRNTVELPLGRNAIQEMKDLPDNADDFFEYQYRRCGTLEDERNFSQIFNRKALLECFDRGELSGALEHRYYVDGDQPSWIESSYTLSRNPVSGDIEAIIYTTDINKKKNIELLLHSVAVNEYDMVLLVDAASGRMEDVYAGRKILVENELERRGTFDKDMETYLRRKCIDMNVDQIIESLRLDNVVRELMTRRAYRVFFTIRSSKGRTLRKEASFYRIDSVGRWICFAMQDVTEAFVNEEKLTNSLRQALQEARSAAEAKNQFFSHISRGIRTPLNSILGLTQIAMAETTDPNAIEGYLVEIKSAALYLSGLIDDILDLRAVEGETILLTPEKLDIRALIRALESIMRPRFDEKGLHFYTETRKLVTPRVLADRRRLEQILIKLLDNAVAFTPDGGEVRLIVSELLRRERDVTLEFTVSDTGVGISSEKISDIFAPFEYGGTVEGERESIGIGLTLARNYAEAMDGTITVDSTPGKGTEFHVTVTLPVVYEEAPGPNVGQKAVEKTYDFSDKRALVVEDHPLNLEIADRMLREVGFTVVRAINGEEAVRIYMDSETDFDIILMDIRMPVMDGLEATRRIRNMHRHDSRDIPIIAMTAAAFENDIRQSFAAGMNDHLAKPINPKKLYATIDKFVGMKK